MILVDTSVLINFLKGKEDEQTCKLEKAINSKIPYGICGFVYMEVLQGAKTEAEFDILNSYLSSQRFYELKNGEASYEKAAGIFFNCRRKGITLRSSIDALIAQIAIENDLFLLHDDSDFYNIAKIERDLKEY